MACDGWFSWLIHTLRVREIGLFIASSVICLVFAEFVMGVVNSYDQGPVLVADPYLYWVVNPAKNPSGGFMEETFQLGTIDEKRLVYAIGDSFAYGIVPYDDNYLTIIDKNLTDYEIINLGTPGYEPSQYDKILRRYSAIKKPRYVLLNFFVGNDFDKSGQGLYPLDGHLIEVDPRALYVLRRSNLARGIYGGYRSFKGGINSDKNGGPLYDQNGYKDDAFLRVEYERMKISLRETQDIVRKKVNASLDDVGSIVDFCQRNDIGLVVLILPDEYQINDELRGEIYSRYDLDPMDYDIRLPQDTLRGYLDVRGVQYIDLMDPFNESAANIELYATRDSHWNVAGNRLAADSILSEIEGRDLMG